MRALKIFFIFIGCSIATLTFAAKPLSEGWYIEGDVGRSNIHGAEYNPSGSPHITTQTAGFGWGINIGYKFMPYFGLEGGYLNYADVNIRNATTGAQAAEVKNQSYDIAGKAIFPMKRGFELFGKLGISNMSSNLTIQNATVANNLNLFTGNHNAVGALMGLGVSYAITHHLGIHLQGIRVLGNSQTGNVTFFSGGISYLL